MNQIWVDADACPTAIKSILFKAAVRTKVKVVLVANHYMQVPKSPYISLMQVNAGFDVADDEIVARVTAGDLVITSDIPLADEVLTKGAQVVSSRGESLTAENIKPRLNMRDFMDTMRASGEASSGPPPMSNADKQRFANVVDVWLMKTLSNR